MSWRHRLLLYLGALHVGLLVLAVLGLRHRPWKLLVLEVGIPLSMLWCAFLVRRAFLPVELIERGAERIRDADFATRFRKVGEPRTDRLISVYNRMVDHLREERLRYGGR